jgi:hypothetical protein
MGYGEDVDADADVEEDDEEAAEISDEDYVEPHIEVPGIPYMAADAEGGSHMEECEKRHFLRHSYIECTAPFYQDRRGTNIGKFENPTASPHLDSAKVDTLQHLIEPRPCVSDTRCRAVPGWCSSRSRMGCGG